MPVELSRRELIAGGIGFAAGLSVAGHGLVLGADEKTKAALPADGGFAPWDYWLSNSGAGTLRLVAAAILAASPYNTQPWLFRLSENRIELLSDEGRNLAALDPFRREFHMGLGCATENACVAAPSLGLKADAALLPDASKPGLAAIIRLEPTGISRHRHHDMIAERHTHRGPYRLNRPVGSGVLDSIRQQISSPDTKLWLVEAASQEGKDLSELMHEATMRILGTPPLRDGRHRGLLATSMPGADEAALAEADANWVDSNLKVSSATAAIFGHIMVRGSRADHILHMEAGRLWQRIHLEGTLQGLAMQPMNHLIEVIDHESISSQQPSMLARIKLPKERDEWQPIFGFRLGYADAPAPRSPRRPLSMVVI